MASRHEVNLSKAAKILNVGRRTIERYRDRRYILFIKKGEQWITTLDELERFKQYGNRKPDTEAPDPGDEDSPEPKRPLPVSPPSIDPKRLDTSKLSPEELEDHKDSLYPGYVHRMK